MATLPLWPYRLYGHTALEPRSFTIVATPWPTPFSHGVQRDGADATAARPRPPTGFKRLGGPSSFHALGVTSSPSRSHAYTPPYHFAALVSCLGGESYSRLGCRSRSRASPPLPVGLTPVGPCRPTSPALPLWATAPALAQ